MVFQHMSQPDSELDCSPTEEAEGLNSGSCRYGVCHWKYRSICGGGKNGVDPVGQGSALGTELALAFKVLSAIRLRFGESIIG